MNGLMAYWPTTETVETCLRTEAETADEALLLAVHEPLNLLRRPAQEGGQVTLATERDLLDALMRPADDGSAVVVAITGASGVGKSHMVRWLHAQLQRDQRRERLVIVSIPKTASLRQVVKLILQPLGGERYRALEQDLERAADLMDRDQAAELLATAMAEELQNYGQRLEAQIRARTVSTEQGPRINQARHLRTLWRDPAVRDWWLRNVLLRIVDSSVGGSGHPEQRQFRPSDLEPPDQGRVDLTAQVNGALTFFASNAGRDRTTAVEILQEVLDPSLRTIFRFTDALHQRSLDEIVDEIRRELLVEGKELVLLIEDLAALAGIQEPLLKIMIAESDVHGQRIRAPIRSAVAVTDGFLAGRQTVLTRAREQWVVPSEGLAPDDVILRLVSLAGRYLNAARWGLPRLHEAFRRDGDQGVDLYTWVPQFQAEMDAEDAEKLAAFGRSLAGHSLFPFNLAAVTSLASAALQQGGAWSLNPRTFINEVLRKTLVERPAFIAGEFPPTGFRGARLHAEASQQIDYRHYSAPIADRLKTLMFHWGGNPRQMMVPSLDRGVFDAFHLPWPYDPNANPPSARQRLVDAQPAKPRADSEPFQPEPLPRSAYATALETWSPTTRLTSNHPNRTRNLLANALNQRLDLEDLRLHGQKVEASWFWLPPENTVSNPARGIVVRVAEADKEIPAAVIAGLVALDRLDAHQDAWTYRDVESDFASAHALLEKLERPLILALQLEAERDVAILCSALHRQNLLFGTAASAQPSRAPLEELLQATTELVATDEGAGKWRSALDRRRKAVSGRSALQARLRGLIGCYQGTRGDTVLAIDAERVTRAWQSEPVERWVLGLSGRGEKNRDAEDALELLSPANIATLITSLTAVTRELQPTLITALEDESAGRVAWRSELRELTEKALQLSLWPDGFKKAAIERSIERLSTEGFDALRRLKKLAAETPSEVEEQLAALGVVPLPRLVELTSEVTTLRSFLDTLEKSMRARGSAEAERALSERQGLVESLQWDAP